MGKLPEGTTFYNHQQNLSDKARKNGCGLPLTGHLQSPQRDPLLLLESCAQQDPSASKGQQERPSALAPISSWLSSQLFRHIEASWGILGISGHKSKVFPISLPGQYNSMLSKGNTLSSPPLQVTASWQETCKNTIIKEGIQSIHANKTWDDLNLGVLWESPV